MIRFPNCKINLGLHILEKLPDGYHRIETVFYPVPLTDILEIIPSSTGTTSLDVSGIQVEGAMEQNLCYKAWQLLQQECGIPAVHMHLHKMIPSGAGLGGGSSDAATALSIMNELFKLQLTPAVLAEYASRLGMDCPFFLLGTPALGEHKGEILTPLLLDLGDWFIRIVKPAVHSSTAAAYAGVNPQPNRPSLADLITQPVNLWKDLLVNDFETGIFNSHPELLSIRNQLYDQGAVFASISGSGSALFLFFFSKPSFPSIFPGCFCWEGKL